MSRTVLVAREEAHGETVSVRPPDPEPVEPGGSGGSGEAGLGATGAGSEPASSVQLPRVLTRGRMPELGRLLAIGAGQAGATVATALLVEFAFDRLLVPVTTASAERPPLGVVAAVGVALLAAAAGTGALRGAERVTAERLGQAYVHEVRLRLFDVLVHTSARRLAERSQGGQVMRFVGDLSALRQWVSLGLARLVVALTTTAGALVALLLLSRPLAAAVAAVIVVGAASAFLQGRVLRRSVRDARRRRGRLSANVNEKVATVAVVQAFGQEAHERRRLRRQSRRLSAAMVQQARAVGRMRALAEATAGAAGAVVLLVGALTGQAPGAVAAAMTIVGLLVPPLRDLGRVEEYRHGAAVARLKLREVLNRPIEVVDVDGAVELVRGPGRLELREVALDGVLHGVSAVAEPGAVVAIVGPNGAGKSTLLSVAARLLPPTNGSVLLDGQDLAGASLASVRGALGVVSADLPLLRGSVERNLRYRWPSAPVEELARVRRATGLDQVLDELPRGLDTRVREGGAGLSAGQRQRIALARALVGGPQVLLLDEADANLDTDAAEAVDRVVREHRGTVLLVTHRADRLAVADVVWHVADGRIVEVGAPADVLAADGPTARLFGRELGAA